MENAFKFNSTKKYKYVALVDRIKTEFIVQIAQLFLREILLAEFHRSE